MGILKMLAVIFLALLFPAAAGSILPLITDDTGTQGRDNFQLEIGGQYDRDQEPSGETIQGN